MCSSAVGANNHYSTAVHPQPQTFSNPLLKPTPSPQPNTNLQQMSSTTTTTNNNAAATKKAQVIAQALKLRDVRIASQEARRASGQVRRHPAASDQGPHGHRGPDSQGGHRDRGQRLRYRPHHHLRALWLHRDPAREHRRGARSRSRGH